MADWGSDDREMLARILSAESGNQKPVGLPPKTPAPVAFSGVAAAGRGWTDVIGPDGQVVRREGTRAWRNNNPGNIEYGDFATSRGAIGTDGRFAVFPSYEAGRAAKESLLFESPSYQNRTIASAINRYAPPVENDTRNYIGQITSALNVSPDTRLSDLSPQQRIAMLDAMQKVEGFSVGTTSSTGATAMRQPTMTQGQPAPMPQEQQQPGGLRGLLSDPDFYDRLAIGLGGLTMNPNQALMQMSADRIAGRAQTRQDTAATNRTVEYLRSQGRNDLADAVASGSLGGRDAAAILFQEPKASGQILSAAQMREMFPGTQIEEGLYNLKPDGTANKVGGGGNVINIDQRSDSKFEEAFATGDAKTINTVYDAGLQAQRNIGRIDQLEQALAAAPAGGVGVIKQVAGEFGIATEGLGDIQAAQALINSLVPEQRQPGSGPMSDADLALFKQSLPRIINQPDGNRRIIDTMRAIAEYDRAGAAIIQRMRLPNDDPNKIDRGQAFQLLQERPNPLADFRAPAADPASPAGAPAIRTFNPQTGQLE